MRALLLASAAALALVSAAQAQADNLETLQKMQKTGTGSEAFQMVEQTGDYAGQLRKNPARPWPSWRGSASRRTAPRAGRAPICPTISRWWTRRRRGRCPRHGPRRAIPSRCGAWRDWCQAPPRSRRNRRAGDWRASGTRFSATCASTFVSGRTFMASQARTIPSRMPKGWLEMKRTGPDPARVPAPPRRNGR